MRSSLAGKKGYVRVRKHVGDEMTPEKPTKLKYRYLKIDYTNPDDTINRELTWRDKDRIIDDKESNGDAAETGAANDDDDDDVAGCETGVYQPSDNLWGIGLRHMLLFALQDRGAAL